MKQSSLCAEAPDRSASPLFGAKTERKRNVDDRRQNAMAALRAQRDAKATRVEHFKQKRRLEEEKNKDKEDEDVSHAALAYTVPVDGRMKHGFVDESNKVVLCEGEELI